MTPTLLDTAEAYHAAAARTVARQYRDQGYEVIEQQELAPGLRADLVARRGEETVLIEIKVQSGALPQERNLTRLQAYARQQRPMAKLRLVVATPPEEKAIVLEGVNPQLLQWLQEHYAETDLGPDAYPVAVESVDVQQVAFQSGELRAEGLCDVRIEYVASADFDPREEPEVVPVRFTAHLVPTTRQFTFTDVRLAA